MEEGKLGLDDSELAALTGFTTRAAHMMAWMREAWCSADPGNAGAILVALAVLFDQSHSLRRNRILMMKVLLHGHDRADELLAQLAIADAYVAHHMPERTTKAPEGYPWRRQ